MKTALLLFVFPFLVFGTTIEKKSFKIESPIIKREIKKHKDTGEYEVTIIIKKGSLTGFASYKETLPENLNAIVNSSNFADASFSYKDGVVKFLWTSLPNTDQMLVSYTLKTDEKFDKDFPGV